MKSVGAKDTIGVMAPNGIVCTLQHRAAETGSIVLSVFVSGVLVAGASD